MTHSWGNWFFVALDPPGFISVDKPPLPLWVTGLSARLFGVNTWSVLLPSALAGAGAVAVLWVVVRRQFGLVAATIAGLGPGAVAGQRRGQPAEPARAVAAAPAAVGGLGPAAGDGLAEPRDAPGWSWPARSSGWRSTPRCSPPTSSCPAMGVAILIASTTWRRRVVRSLVFGATAIVTSLPWILIVDAVPGVGAPVGRRQREQHRVRPDLRVQRPRSGGGQRRLHPGRPDQQPRRGVRRSARTAAPAVRRAGTAGRLARPAGDRRRGRRDRAPPPPTRPPGARGDVGAVARSSSATCSPTPWARSTRTTPRCSVPGVAALIGIGVVALVALVRREPRWWIAVGVAVGGTVVLQLIISGRHPTFYGWTRWLLIVGAVLAAAALASSSCSAARRARTIAVAGGVLLGDAVAHADDVGRQRAGQPGDERHAAPGRPAPRRGRHHVRLGAVRTATRRSPPGWRSTAPGCAGSWSPPPPSRPRA